MASKETQEIVDRLTAMDDTFFHKLVEDKDFCEELIQTVTGKKSIRLLEATAQKSLRNIKGRSVVLDAYCVDTENDNYDLEIQKKDDDDHQKRVRYNGSNMDTLKEGKGRDSMCAIVEDYAEKKAREREKEQAKQTALKFLKMGKLSVEEIAEGIPVLSVEEIIELQESVLQIS